MRSGAHGREHATRGPASARPAGATPPTLGPVVHAGGSAIRAGDAYLGPGEAQRLVALYQLDVLDSPSAECFDRVVRLASRMFEVPVARIALVDAVREWCLAGIGAFEGDVARELSFADQVVRAGDVLVVEDALTSLPWVDHPAVKGEPYVRFVAGCPLRSAAGAVVGALYVVGSKPRVLGPTDVQVLRDLAGVVDDELALRANRCFDERTGLLLRRGLDIVGNQVVSRAKRRGEPVSLVVLDVDTSPAVMRRNRLAGRAAHPATDVEAALELFARVIKDVTRSSDVPARLPCDELIVLLPDTDERRCAHVARRIVAELERAAPIGIADPFVVQVATATVDGCEDEMSLAELLRRAEPFERELAGSAQAPFGTAGR